MNANEIVQTLREQAAEYDRRGYIGEATERYAIIDLIESLQADAASYQQVKKALRDKGFDDLSTMISRIRQVVADTNEVDIMKDELTESLQARAYQAALAGQEDKTWN